MGWRIREIGPADFEDSAGVIREAFGTVAEEFGFTEENNPKNGAFIKPEKLLAEYEKGIKMFGLYEEDRQAGFVAVEDKEGETFYLEKLAVIPEHRHKGYGKMLIDYARDFVKQAGGKRISIAIINENAKLKQWYGRYGFVETSVRKFEHLTFTVCYMEIDVQ